MTSILSHTTGNDLSVLTIQYRTSIIWNLLFSSRPTQDLHSCRETRRSESMSQKLVKLLAHFWGRRTCKIHTYSIITMTELSSTQHFLLAHKYVNTFGIKVLQTSSCNRLARIVQKFISSNRQCQNVSLSITNMFVLDHKEKVSLINHKIVCD